MKYYYVSHWVLFYFIKLFIIKLFFYWYSCLFTLLMTAYLICSLPAPSPCVISFFIFFFFNMNKNRARVGAIIVIHPLKRDHRGTPARCVISLMCSNSVRIIRLQKKKKKEEVPFLLWWKLPFYTHACFWIFLLQMIRCNFWAIGSN